MSAEQHRDSPRPVVVGIDGSPPSSAALRWGLDQARRLGAPVKVVVVWAYPYFGDVPIGVASDGAAGIDSARELVANALGDARHHSPDATLEGVVVEGGPGPSLVDATAGAQLVVLGARGAGGFTRLLLGSVSDYVLRHASCPVAIVRGDVATAGPDADGAAAVVGVDGSASSIEALHWAAAFARAQQRPLVIVAAWHFPVITGLDGMAGPIPWFDVETETSDLVTKIRKEHADELAGLDIRVDLRHGSASAVLLDAAEGASVLVLGDHQRKGLARFLGSVATQCAHHATCPLVVVRSTDHR